MFQLKVTTTYKKLFLSLVSSLSVDWDKYIGGGALGQRKFGMQSSMVYSCRILLRTRSRQNT